MKRLLLILGLMPATLLAQQAEVSGYVKDPSGASVPDAKVKIVSVDRGWNRSTASNTDGIYSILGLDPGRYELHVEKQGFQSLVRENIVLEVAQRVTVDVELKVGDVAQVVNVDAGSPMINTIDASVSTVVERQLVENMPLNGRSFQELVLLTPGIVTNNPNAALGNGYSGDFSVNGQRTESNYYTVDGVSANIGVASGSLGAGSTGSLPGATALGTTQALVSIDALQEFRVATSTYSAEYGRNPGAQISFSTRSGTNDWHGSISEYLRNNFFDANDWFTNYLSKPAAALRQNDLGATIGGPVRIPHIYNGYNKTAFFISYEGLRLTQPSAPGITYVPNSALRQSAAPELQPFMNAFPIPNGPDLGNGLAEYIGTTSTQNSIDAMSVRLDHSINEKMKLFFRFGGTPSTVILTNPQNGPQNQTAKTVDTHTYTGGAVVAFSNHVSNDFHLNYSSNVVNSLIQVVPAGGSTPTDVLQGEGATANRYTAYESFFAMNFPGYSSELVQGKTIGDQRQWNAVDSASFLLGRHQIKIGIDFRRLTPVIAPGGRVEFVASSAVGVQQNSGEGIIINAASANPLYVNFSAFVQDEWRITNRLNLSMGLRWEVNPAPGSTNGGLPYTVRGTSPGTVQLAPQGTPLWRTTWYDVAPRLGLAYALKDTPGWQTVVRVGAGVFFDTAQQAGSEGYNGPGFSSPVTTYNPTLLPFTPTQLNVPITNPPVPPYGTVYAYADHLQLPYSWQWNTSLEQALGKAQTLTISYVGSHGSRLLEESEVNVKSFNPQFGYVVFYQNGLTSDYDALQLQYQRRLSNRFTAFASYTWSHCLDYGSQNLTFGYQRGNCDFDIRHSFTSAVMYDLPNVYTSTVGRNVLGHWGVDARFTARTAFPVNFTGNDLLNPVTGQVTYSGLNLVPGVPVYLYDSSYPGGRRINPAAFQLPAANQAGDAPRNSARGFDAVQLNVAVRKDFSIYESLKLQFRAEAFNLFNHPNFGSIQTAYGNTSFGEATGTLANSVATSLSPIYQLGGARSMQFSLRVIF